MWKINRFEHAIVLLNLKDVSPLFAVFLWKVMVGLYIYGLSNQYMFDGIKLMNFFMIS